MIRRFEELAVLALALSLPLAACDDTTGLGGEARILLTSSSSPSAAIVANMVPGTDLAAVDLAVVDSIDVTITRVEALRTGASEDDERAWTELEVLQADVNLMSLTTDGLEIARGELPAGSYGNVRFFFEDARITFSEDVVLPDGGNGQTFEGNTEHELQIPSGGQTGIKIPSASFEIGDGDTTVAIEFDAGTSVQTVTAAGSSVIMSPTLTARNDD